MTDLFWLPTVGQRVRVKPGHGCGVRAFDDFPLLVKRASALDGVTIFACETTGPVTTTKTKAGQTLSSHPQWQGYYLAEELEPAEVHS